MFKSCRGHNSEIRDVEKWSGTSHYLRLRAFQQDLKTFSRQLIVAKLSVMKMKSRNIRVQ